MPIAFKLRQWAFLFKYVINQTGGKILSHYTKSDEI